MSIGRADPKDQVIRVLRAPFDILAFAYPFGAEPGEYDYMQIHIVGYDTTNPESYAAACNKIHTLQAQGEFCVLVGQTFSGRQRRVSSADARNLANTFKVPYYEYDVRGHDAKIELILQKVIQEHRLNRQNIAINNAMSEHKLDTSDHKLERKGESFYHNFEKKSIKSKYHEQVKKARDNRARIMPMPPREYFRYKIRLALDIENAGGKVEEDIYSLLLKTFKDEYVFSVKFPTVHNVREKAVKHAVTKEKGADIFFARPDYLEKAKQDELDVLANHVRIMRTLDRTIRNLELPVTRVNNDIKKLGLKSDAITVVSIPDEKDRDIYTKMNEVAKKELAEIKTQIERLEWKIGVFGGEKLFKDKRKVPAGVKAIYDELKKDDDRTDLEHLAVIKRLITSSQGYTGHGCFNRRAHETQRFYDEWSTRLNKLVKKVEDTLSAPAVHGFKFR